MTTDTQTANRTPSARKAGRPRRLTLEMVLDAANEMGIENVSMKKLAVELDVGIATIYRYVADRDDLVRMALARRGSHPFIVTRDMEWPDVLRGYARSLYSVVSQDSFPLTSFMRGGFGVTSELEFVDTLIREMTQRGFDADEAGRICRMVHHQVGGAAMGKIHLMALEAAGTTRQQIFADAIAAHDGDSLSYAKAAANVLFDDEYVSDWRPGVDLLIDGLLLQHPLS